MTDEEVLLRVKEERNILHAIKRRRPNWIVRILRRNCLIKHVIEGKIEGKRRRGRRPKQLLDDLNVKRRLWNLKAVALRLTLWRTRSGRGYVRNDILRNE
jgi:hypothetical protein